MEYVIPDKLKVQIRTIERVCKRDCKRNWDIFGMLESLVTASVEHGKYSSTPEAIALLKRVRYGHFDSVAELEDEIDKVLEENDVRL